MAIQQEARPSDRETADAFVAMLGALRAEFEREAVPVRDEARGRPLALAGPWLAEQEGLLWARLLASSRRQQEIVPALIRYWKLPVELRFDQAASLRRYDDIMHRCALAMLRSACVQRNALAYEHALVALVVCDEGRDWRGTLMKLCLFWHAGLRLGLQSGQIFVALAGNATPRAAELLRDFAGRALGDQRLDAFGHSQRDLDRLFEVME